MSFQKGTEQELSVLCLPHQALQSVTISSAKTATTTTTQEAQSDHSLSAVWPTVSPNAPRISTTTSTLVHRHGRQVGWAEINRIEMEFYKETVHRLQQLLLHAKPSISVELIALQGDMKASKVVDKISKALQLMMLDFTRMVRPVMLVVAQKSGTEHPQQQQDTNLSLAALTQVEMSSVMERKVRTLLQRTELASILVDISIALMRYLLAGQQCRDDSPSATSHRASYEISHRIGKTLDNDSVHSLDLRLDQVLEILHEENLTTIKSTTTSRTSRLLSLKKTLQVTLRCFQNDFERKMQQLKQLRPQAFIKATSCNESLDFINRATQVQVISLGCAAAVASIMWKNHDLIPLQYLYHKLENSAGEARELCLRLALVNIHQTSPPSSESRVYEQKASHTDDIVQEVRAVLLNLQESSICLRKAVARWLLTEARPVGQVRNHATAMEEGFARVATIMDVHQVPRPSSSSSSSSSVTAKTTYLTATEAGTNSSQWHALSPLASEDTWKRLSSYVASDLANTETDHPSRNYETLHLERAQKLLVPKSDLRDVRVRSGSDDAGNSSFVADTVTLPNIREEEDDDLLEIPPNASITSFLPSTTTHQQGEDDQTPHKMSPPDTTLPLCLPTTTDTIAEDSLSMSSPKVCQIALSAVVATLPKTNPKTKPTRDKEKAPLDETMQTDAGVGLQHENNSGARLSQECYDWNDGISTRVDVVMNPARTLTATPVTMTQSCDQTGQEIADFQFALRLEEQLQRKNQSVTGRAYMFALKIQELCDRLRRESGPDDAAFVGFVEFGTLIHMAERLIMARGEFELRGRPCRVDLGYHFTTKNKLSCLDTGGLVTEGESAEREDDETRLLPPGVHTTTYPHRYLGEQKLEVGVILARLRGMESNWMDKRSRMQESDSVVFLRDLPDEIIILKQTNQCLPMMYFPFKIRRKTAVRQYQSLLKGIVDHFLNEGNLPPQRDPFPTSSSINHSTRRTTTGARSGSTRSAENALQQHLEIGVDQSTPGHAASSTSTHANQQRRLSEISIPTAVHVTEPASQIQRHSRSALSTTHVTAVERITYVAPEKIQPVNLAVLCREIEVRKTPKENCPICQWNMQDLPFQNSFMPHRLRRPASVCLTACGHVLHRSCLISALENLHHACPVCRKIFVTPRGEQPSGKMLISKDPTLTCSGDESGTIVIDYITYEGKQKSYHAIPGSELQRSHYRAYLPNNVDGCNLVKRLKYAYQCGLTFKVNRQGRVEARIQHKTSVDGSCGMDGYPDENYFDDVHRRLNRLNVPPAEHLDEPYYQSYVRALQEEAIQQAKRINSSRGLQ